MSEVKSNRAWRLECETLQQDVVRLLAERTHMRTELLQDIERLTAELADCKDMQKVDQRFFEQLTETRDLAEHWMIIAEQRRMELEECRKLQDLSYMDGLVMRMTYRNGDKVFNVQRVNTLAQLERVSLGAKFIVEVNANDMWQDLLAAMEAKP